jgi:cell division septation protein DedD
MDEQVTWKGQSFTLLVFGGIVFLCSIFFVLGMLVGRGQGKSAAAEPDKVKEAAESAENASSARGAKPTNSSHESITLGQEANKDFKVDEVKEPAPAPARTPTPEKSVKPTPKAAVSPTPAPPAATPKAAPSKPASPTPVKMIYLQVNAVASDTAAKKQAAELQKAGFTSVVMGGGDGAKSLYKVQVGPFATTADMDIAKHKLEALGYKPIRK